MLRPCPHRIFLEQLFGPGWSVNEVPAAVGAYACQFAVSARRAEGALEGADPCVGCAVGQLFSAAFAFWADIQDSHLEPSLSCARRRMQHVRRFPSSCAHRESYSQPAGPSRIASATTHRSPGPNNGAGDVSPAHRRRLGSRCTPWHQGCRRCRGRCRSAGSCVECVRADRDWR
jgi:hypothetical protein